jgi:geranylgeranyl diphosphate synthase type II
VIRALKEFTEILGSFGVTLGQADDLYGGESNAKFLRRIHMRKTALFIAFSMRIGAILAGVEEDTLSELQRGGILAGMGFQIMDDILDVKSSLKDLGKTPGKDSEGNKLTYPSIYGLEYSERLAKGYARRAKKIFTDLGEKWKVLSLLTDYLVVRNK